MRFSTTFGISGLAVYSAI